MTIDVTDRVLPRLGAGKHRPLSRVLQRRCLFQGSVQRGARRGRHPAHLQPHVPQVGEPRFVVSERVVDEHAVLLVWTFHYLVRKWGKDQAQVIRGVSHLKFDADGRVNFHRDYWDAAEELYMKLPVLGMLMRRLRRALAA
jgi:hypothetical protein